MKVSDYVAQFLAANDVRHVFGLQGGAVVHLFDSIEATPGTSAIYCHHEQAAALAATSYAKMTGGLGAVVVTTGPGATNALTGLLAAWQDSVPVIFISGQTRVEHTSYGKPVRQVGSQEVNILDLVRPITKFSTLIKKPEEIETALRDAHFHALDGRPGPVWIDLPVNLQWEMPDLAAPVRLPVPNAARTATGDQTAAFAELAAMIRAAKAPVIVAGTGIRMAECEAQFLDFITTTGIPFVSSWTASDLTDSDNPLYGGIIGLSGQRGANKILYNADLIVCLGNHLSVTQTGTLFDKFAPQAKKAVVNIDQGELDNLNIAFDLKIHADLRDFFAYVATQSCTPQDMGDWHSRFAGLKALNSVVDTLTAKASLGDQGRINSNYFNIKLTQRLPANSHLVVDGGGTALYTGFQSSSLKTGQRIICSSAISAMGTGFPEAVGVSLAAPGAEIYCVIGDGSLMLNLQELQTIQHHHLPVKIIVYNNDGYLAIKHTQKAFLGARYHGTDAQHGLSVPAINKVAECFGFAYMQVTDVAQVDSALDAIFAHQGSLMVEVAVPSEQTTLFQQGFEKIAEDRFRPVPLSEMAPFVE